MQQVEDKKQQQVVMSRSDKEEMSTEVIVRVEQLNEVSQTMCTIIPLQIEIIKTQKQLLDSDSSNPNIAILESVQKLFSQFNSKLIEAKLQRDLASKAITDIVDKSQKYCDNGMLADFSTRDIYGPTIRDLEEHLDKLKKVIENLDSIQEAIENQQIMQSQDPTKNLETQKKILSREEGIYKQMYEDLKIMQQKLQNTEYTKETINNRLVMLQNKQQCIKEDMTKNQQLIDSTAKQINSQEVLSLALISQDNTQSEEESKITQNSYQLLKDQIEDINKYIGSLTKKQKENDFKMLKYLATEEGKKTKGKQKDAHIIFVIEKSEDMNEQISNKSMIPQWLRSCKTKFDKYIGQLKELFEERAQLQLPYKETCSVIVFSQVAHTVFTSLTFEEAAQRLSKGIEKQNAPQGSSILIGSALNQAKQCIQNSPNCNTVVLFTSSGIEKTSDKEASLTESKLIQKAKKSGNSKIIFFSIPSGNSYDEQHLKDIAFAANGGKASIKIGDDMIPNFIEGDNDMDLYNTIILKSIKVLSMQLDYHNKQKEFLQSILAEQNDRKQELSQLCLQDARTVLDAINNIKDTQKDCKLTFTKQAIVQLDGKMNCYHDKQKALIEQEDQVQAEITKQMNELLKVNNKDEAQRYLAKKQEELAKKEAQIYESKVKIEKLEADFSVAYNEENLQQKVQYFKCYSVGFKLKLKDVVSFYKKIYAACQLVIPEIQAIEGAIQNYTYDHVIDVMYRFMAKAYPELETEIPNRHTLKGKSAMVQLISKMNNFTETQEENLSLIFENLTMSNIISFTVPKQTDDQVLFHCKEVLKVGLEEKIAKIKNEEADLKERQIELEDILENQADKKKKLQKQINKFEEELYDLKMRKGDSVILKNRDLAKQQIEMQQCIFDKLISEKKEIYEEMMKISKKLFTDDPQEQQTEKLERQSLKLKKKQEDVDNEILESRNIIEQEQKKVAHADVEQVITFRDDALQEKKLKLAGLIESINKNKTEIENIKDQIKHLKKQLRLEGNDVEKRLQWITILLSKVRSSILNEMNTFKHDTVNQMFNCIKETIKKYIYKPQNIQEESLQEWKFKSNATLLKLGYEVQKVKAIDTQTEKRKSLKRLRDQDLLDDQVEEQSERGLQKRQKVQVDQSEHEDMIE